MLEARICCMDHVASSDVFCILLDTLFNTTFTHNMLHNNMSDKKIILYIVDIYIYMLDVFCFNEPQICIQN